MYETILQNIQKHIQLDEEELEYFYSLLSRKQLNKKEFLLLEGQLCKTISFVEEGSLRAFYVNEEGKESTVMFAVKDWWVTDMPCFVHQKPALVSIEALEKSRIIQLSYTQLELLYQKVPKFERLFRILMQNAYIREQLRVIDTMSLKAEDRYHKFIKKYPQIVSKVTQKQLASYLGITPEFLSAIKKK